MRHAMRPLEGVRHLSFEIGPRCDLAREHEWCPAHNRRFKGGLLETSTIIHCVNMSRALGFAGFIGFHFYNEPLLYPERIAEVMDACPKMRYMLWTNGIHIDLELVERFDWVVKSDYADPNYHHDARIGNYEGEARPPRACYRPLVECAIDYVGDVHLCCQDWRNSVKVGNITTDFASVMDRWRDTVDKVTVGEVQPVCSTCRGAQNFAAYQSALRAVGM